MTSTTLSSPASNSAAMADLSPAKKLLLLLCNLIALMQFTGVGLIIWWLRQRPGLCVALVLIVVYLLPPLLCRAVLVLFPIRKHIVPVGSRDFFVWWFVLNLQVIFCRFAALEEILRVIPSCYSMWLRLWGAKIGKLTYWAAGLRILDRQALIVGDYVTFGAGVRINPHVIFRDPRGRPLLALAPVRIGDRASVGGYSLLVAGAQIAAGESTRACLTLPPFNRWENGRRHRPADPSLDVNE